MDAARTSQRLEPTEELIALRRYLSPQSETKQPPTLPDDGTLLRMYPEDGRPRPGSLVSDVMDFDSHWHFHDMHQLIFASSGACDVETEHGRHLLPRQLAAWIPAGVNHRVSLREFRSTSIFLPADMIAHAGDRIRTIMVGPLMREMLREALRWPLHSPENDLRQAFYQALAKFCEEWINDEADLFIPTCRDPAVQRALVFTSKNVAAKLPEVCQAAGMSERTLRRHLKAETGLTWEAFRRRTRLLRALTLLEEERLPISQIAPDCGFESQSAFAKAFRTAMGVAPSRYRSRKEDN